MQARTAASSDGVADRIRRIQEALGYESATALVVSTSRLGNVTGGSALSRDLAFKLVKKVPGLTLDWLYFGKPDGLPLGLAKRLKVI
jgi:hypothetical protein